MTGPKKSFKTIYIAVLTYFLRFKTSWKGPLKVEFISVQARGGSSEGRCTFLLTVR